MTKAILGVLALMGLMMAGCASTGGDNSGPAIHGHIDAADKTILILLGSSDLMGRVKDLFRDECWTVNVTDDTGGVTTDTMVSQTRYRLEVGATSEPLIFGFPLYLIGYDYNLSLIDTETGEELLNLHGYGSSRKVIARIKRALEDLDNGTCTEQ